MNKYILYITLFLSVVFSCTVKTTDQLFKINPNGIIHQSYALSDLANEIRYVPLDNEQIIPFISEIELSNNKFFLNIKEGKLLAFNRDGTFDRFIGQKGHGPGEYVAVAAFAIDEQDRMVYVLDHRNIRQYSFDGDFVKNISLEKFGADFYNILFQDDKLYLFEYLYYGHSKYNWLILDKNGNEIASKMNSIKPFKTGWPGPHKTSYKLDNEIKYWNMYNDTIFTIQSTVYKPYILFDKGNHRCPQQKSYSIDYDKYWYPDGIIETKKYLFINSLWKGCRQLFCLDKQDNQMCLIDKELIGEDWEMKYGIDNNLDGGPYLEPTFYFQINNEEYLVSSINAFDLKAHVASEAFKNSTPKYPEKKSELEKLANNLNDNDNPVLMLVKLKE